jgi:hypothetical protein
VVVEDNLNIIQDVIQQILERYSKENDRKASLTVIRSINEDMKKVKRKYIKKEAKSIESTSKIILNS